MTRVIAFQTSITVARPIDDVFAYVADPGNLSAWNSAVGDVRPIAPEPNGAGRAYEMERRLPTGRATNRLDVIASDRPHDFAIRATAGPTPFIYRYRFADQEGETVVQLDAQVDLEGFAALAPPLARLAVKHGVDDNLATLKRILENSRERGS
jgi:Polyketide cyclase / dehydrase and lipid transport